MDGNGAVTDWRVWCCPAGTSAQLILRDPGDKVFERQVYDFLCGKTGHGYERVLTRQEAQAEHLDGNFSILLETDGCTQFAADWEGAYAAVVPQGVAGMHGHHPDKGPDPVFIGCGPAFRKGAVLDRAELVDGAPTYAHILDTSLPHADGRVLTELLIERRRMNGKSDR